MKDLNTFFKGKKVTVMRIGLIGRGIGDTRYLAEAGAQIIVADAAPEDIMQPAVNALKEYENIQFKFGPYDFEDFKGADMVLVGAGAPLDEPVLIACREQGVRLAQSAALFAELSGVPIIGVTGTRGKSTVTHMIHHVLRETTEGGAVLLGGNVRGVSNLELLHHVEDDSLAVMELDSWQLQGFGWAGISPQIAVFTNFMEDHLTYYKGSMDAYFADKAQIFLHQGAGDTLVTTNAVFALIQSFMKKEGRELKQEVKLTDASVFPDDIFLKILGEHNRLNAALALEALRAVDLSDKEILPSLASFKGVEGRLEYLGEKNGVKVYNDNNATTPSATIAGLRALTNKKNIVLIVGGTDKEIDLSELAQEIPTYCKAVILYEGTGTLKLKKALSSQVPRFEYERLADCVHRAFEESVAGDTILFSPAFSSFGKYFRNEYDRGDQFVELVSKLLN